MHTRRWWLVALAGTALVAGACRGEGATSESAAAPGAGSATSDGRAVAPAPPRDAAAGVAQSSSGAPSAEKGGTSGGSGGSSLQLPSADRRIVYTVTLDMTFKDVTDGFQRISLLAEGNGGFVADSQMRQDNKQQRGSLTIRVPAGRYQELLAQVRGLGTVESERATASDVTEEFVDLEARQRTLEATEQSLLTLLGQAKTVQEILTVQDRLTTVRADIERLKGRQNLLSRQTEYATIQVSLRPIPATTTDPKSESGAMAALRRGWEASLDVVGGVGRGLLTATAFSWWLIPFVPVAVWAARRALRRRRPGTVEVVGPVASDGAR